MLIKSNLNHLLESSALVPVTPHPLNQYQGPSIPMPTLQNDVVYIPKVDKMQCKLLFDLKFSIATDNEQPCQNVSLPPKSAESVCADDKKCLTQKSRMYHEPPLETDIDSLGWKKFARETDKKIRWVLKMYHQWREERNKHPDLIHI